MSEELEVQDLQEPADAATEHPAEAPAQGANESDLEYKNRVEMLEERNKQLYARAKKAEDKAKLYETERERTRPSYSDNDVEEIVHLRTDGYSREEVEMLKVFAKGKGASLSEVAKDPFIKRAIEANRGQVQTEQATPAPSSRPVTSQIGAANNQKAWAEMSTDERRSNFDNFKQRFRKQRSNE